MKRVVTHGEGQLTGCDGKVFDEEFRCGSDCRPWLKQRSRANFGICQREMAPKVNDMTESVNSIPVARFNYAR